MKRKKKIDFGFTPSEYQEKIFDFVTEGVGNACISASAGAAKTSTVVAAIRLIPSKLKCIFLAFNKSIAEELSEKLKDYPNVHVRTSHSLGFLMLRRNIGNSIEIDEYKYRTYIKNNITELTTVQDLIQTRQQLDDYLTTILDLVNFARFNYCQSVKEIDEIAKKYSFPIQYDECEVVLKVLKWGKENVNVIDFTDMIWLPVELKMKPMGLQYDWIFVDECFPYSQKVVTSEGKMSIGTLYKNFNENRPLPLIKTYNEIKDCFEWKRIIGASKHEQRQVVEVTCGTKRKFKCTPNEKFLTSKGYCYLSELQEGDIIYCSSTSQPYHSILTNEQEEIFLSQKLGDGSIEKLSKNVYRCCIIHGEKQKEYIEWKNYMLGNNKLEYIKENGISKNPAYRFNTKGFCVKEEKLDILNIIHKFSLKQLAINYQDNGSLCGRTSRLYSCVHNLQHIETLRQRIIKLINVKPNDIKVCEGVSNISKKKYYYIVFNTFATRQLHKNIAQYVNNSLRCKIINEFQPLVSTYIWENNTNTLGGIVITSIKMLDKKEDVYDIEVEDNHNFIITSNGIITKHSKDGLKNGIIVHNCQDQSVVSIELFKKCFKRGTRCIFVGDQDQTIYTFSGSSEQAFDTLRTMPNTQEFELPISYRCDKNIIKLANRFVPKIKSRENADDGVILENCSIFGLKENDMVLARTKAPLIKLYTKLLRRGVNCYIKGQDIGSSLIKKLEGFDNEDLNPNLDKDGIFVKLYQKLFKDRNKLMERRGLDFDDATLSSSIMEQYDNINTLTVLAIKCKTRNDLIEHIKTVFGKNENGICLSTIHKAKGLEADNVYILCHSTMPSKLAQQDWERKQELNLIYVAYTRAKHKLGFISESEIPPCGSSQEPMEIINDLMFIENKICKLFNTEPTVRMSNVDIAKFNLKNATIIKENDEVPDINTIKSQTSANDLLSHLHKKLNSKYNLD